MAWVRTEDTARLHVKFFRAGVAAWGWWNGALGYCNQHLSDGFIPSRDVDYVFPGTPREDTLRYIETLIGERTLHMLEPGRKFDCSRAWCLKRARELSTESGFIMHDFKEYQFLAKHVKKLRRIRSQAGRQGGKKSALSRQQIASTLLDKSPAKRNPVPSRPVPSLNLKTSVAVATNSNGHETRPRKHPLHGLHCDCDRCKRAREWDAAHPEAGASQA
jgi:hypothetical protein